MVESRKTRSTKKQTKKVLKTNKTVKMKKAVPRPESAPEVRYEMPHGYDIDTIVLMPVNRDTSFIYWEITDRLLHGSQQKLKSGSAQLMIKVFEEYGIQEVCSFEVSERIGNSYINYQSSLKPFVAEIGISNGKGYAGLLKSRTLSAPNYSQSLTGKKSPRPLSGSSETRKELWMTRKKDRREIKSLPAGGSSDKKSGMMEYYREVAVFHDSSLFSKI